MWDINCRSGDSAAGTLGDSDEILGALDLVTSEVSVSVSEVLLGNVSNCLYCCHLVILDVCIWSGWVWILQDRCEVHCGLHGNIHGDLYCTCVCCGQNWTMLEFCWAFNFVCEDSLAVVVLEYWS
jgi:hypothetical protein